MNTQPNFEKVKKLFYEAYINSEQTENALLLTNLTNFPQRKLYYKRLEDFRTDLNKWLDNVDIRQAGILIDLAALKISIPAWLKNKKYCIDYNKHNFLDLIRLS